MGLGFRVCVRNRIAAPFQACAPFVPRQALNVTAKPFTLSADPPSTSKTRVPEFTCLCNYTAVLADTVPDVVHDDGDDDDDGGGDDGDDDS